MNEPAPATPATLAAMPPNIAAFGRPYPVRIETVVTRHDTAELYQIMIDTHGRAWSRTGNSAMGFTPWVNVTMPWRAEQ